jgi:hypothetical protein
VARWHARGPLTIVTSFAFAYLNALVVKIGTQGSSARLNGLQVWKQSTKFWIH